MNAEYNLFCQSSPCVAFRACSHFILIKCVFSNSGWISYNWDRNHTVHYGSLIQGKNQNKVLTILETNSNFMVLNEQVMSTIFNGIIGVQIKYGTRRGY